MRAGRGAWGVVLLGCALVTTGCDGGTARTAPPTPTPPPHIATYEKRQRMEVTLPNGKWVRLTYPKSLSFAGYSLIGSIDYRTRSKDLGHAKHDRCCTFVLDGKVRERLEVGTAVTPDGKRIPVRGGRLETPLRDRYEATRGISLQYGRWYVGLGDRGRTKIDLAAANRIVRQLAVQTDKNGYLVFPKRPGVDRADATLSFMRWNPGRPSRSVWITHTEAKCRDSDRMRQSYDYRYRVLCYNEVEVTISGKYTLEDQRWVRELGDTIAFDRLN